jgi:hypothetical protein
MHGIPNYSLLFYFSSYVEVNIDKKTRKRERLIVRQMLPFLKLGSVEVTRKHRLLLFLVCFVKALVDTSRE